MGPGERWGSFNFTLELIIFLAGLVYKFYYDFYVTANIWFVFYSFYFRIPFNEILLLFNFSVPFASVALTLIGLL